MSELFLHGKRTTSIFQLLGDHENDISYSVGWALAKCPSFLGAVLKKLVDWEGTPTDVEVRLQQSETQGRGGVQHSDESEPPAASTGKRSKGQVAITDIEITHPSAFYIIIEAKRGWCLPGADQLEKYARRESFIKSSAKRKVIVAASECSIDYALRNLPFNAVAGVPVDAISWKVFHDLAVRAGRQGSHAEKRLLLELTTYLKGLMTMQKLDSNWVYVLSLSDAIQPGWSISWIDIVSQRNRYFHPVGIKGFPATPPNYVAFRYGGRLRSIHHVEDYTIVTDLHDGFDEIPSAEVEPHFIYKLGQGFAPTRDVPMGKIWGNGRVWCMLDTLFTASSIAEARDISKKREAALD